VHRIRLGDSAGQHVRFDGKKNASGLQRANHALQGLTGRREMVEQGTREDEIVGAFFYYILKDIDSADLETRQLLVHDTTEIDVARDDVASGCHALSQSPRDRSVATTEFQTAPAWTHSQLSNVSKLDGIQQR
jgi:hypothetical protein